MNDSPSSHAPAFFAESSLQNNGYTRPNPIGARAYGKPLTQTEEKTFDFVSSIANLRLNINASPLKSYSYSESSLLNSNHGGNLQISPMPVSSPSPYAVPVPALSTHDNTVLQDNISTIDLYTPYTPNNPPLPSCFDFNRSTASSSSLSCEHTVSSPPICPYPWPSAKSSPTPPHTWAGTSNVSKNTDFSCFPPSDNNNISPVDANGISATVDIPFGENAHLSASKNTRFGASANTSQFFSGKTPIPGFFGPGTRPRSNATLASSLPSWHAPPLPPLPRMQEHLQVQRPIQPGLNTESQSQANKDEQATTTANNATIGRTATALTTGINIGANTIANTNGIPNTTTALLPNYNSWVSPWPAISRNMDKSSQGSRKNPRLDGWYTSGNVQDVYTWNFQDSENSSENVSGNTAFPNNPLFSQAWDTYPNKENNLFSGIASFSRSKSNFRGSQIPNSHRPTGSVKTITTASTTAPAHADTASATPAAGINDVFSNNTGKDTAAGAGTGAVAGARSGNDTVIVGGSGSTGTGSAGESATLLPVLTDPPWHSSLRTNTQAPSCSLASTLYSTSCSSSLSSSTSVVAPTTATAAVSSSINGSVGCESGAAIRVGHRRTQSSVTVLTSSHSHVHATAQDTHAHLQNAQTHPPSPSLSQPPHPSIAQPVPPHPLSPVSRPPAQSGSRSQPQSPPLSPSPPSTLVITIDSSMAQYTHSTAPHVTLPPQTFAATPTAPSTAPQPHSTATPTAFTSLAVQPPTLTCNAMHNQRLSLPLHTSTATTLASVASSSTATSSLTTTSSLMPSLHQFATLTPPLAPARAPFSVALALASTQAPTFSTILPQLPQLPPPSEAYMNTCADTRTSVRMSTSMGVDRRSDGDTRVEMGVMYDNNDSYTHKHRQEKRERAEHELGCLTPVRKTRRIRRLSPPLISRTPNSPDCIFPNGKRRKSTGKGVFFRNGTEEHDIRIDYHSEKPSISGQVYPKYGKYCRTDISAVNTYDNDVYNLCDDNNDNMSDDMVSLLPPTLNSRSPLTQTHNSIHTLASVSTSTSTCTFATAPSAITPDTAAPAPGASALTVALARQHNSNNTSNNSKGRGDDGALAAVDTGMVSNGNDNVNRGGSSGSRKDNGGHHTESHMNMLIPSSSSVSGAKDNSTGAGAGAGVGTGIEIDTTIGLDYGSIDLLYGIGVPTRRRRTSVPAKTTKSLFSSSLSSKSAFSSSLSSSLSSIVTNSRPTELMDLSPITYKHTHTNTDTIVNTKAGKSDGGMGPCSMSGSIISSNCTGMVNGSECLSVDDGAEVPVHSGTRGSVGPYGSVYECSSGRVLDLDIDIDRMFDANSIFGTSSVFGSAFGSDNRSQRGRVDGLCGAAAGDDVDVDGNGRQSVGNLDADGEDVGLTGSGSVFDGNSVGVLCADSVLDIDHALSESS